ncbi:MAG: protein kinase [Byssovorax sp.]
MRVLDLGAGKFHRSGLLTTSGGTLGTVPYMAPEQIASGSTIDGRSDLYSLGIVLIEMISGVHPLAPQGFENENMFTFVRKIVAGPRWRSGTLRRGYPSTSPRSSTRQSFGTGSSATEARPSSARRSPGPFSASSTKLVRGNRLEPSWRSSAASPASRRLP